MSGHDRNLGILISLLKQYNVKRIVISPGTRNIPFVRMVEADPDFMCYLVVDERNAAFFALGLSQQSGEAVALTCTSGTSVSNYLPGFTEAFYSHAPIVAITFDRSQYTLDQLETQMIDQIATLACACKKSAACPVIKDDDDAWYFQRIVNEALIAMRQHLPGPVQINIPIAYDTNFFYREPSGQEFYADAVKIEHVVPDDERGWTIHWEKLCAAKRVLIVMGQRCQNSAALCRDIKRFCSHFHVPVLTDHLSNFYSEEVIPAEAVIKALNSKTIEAVLPEIVITLGANFQERIKDLFKAHRGEFAHWSIEPAGVVKDVFKSETALFECTPEQFFASFADRAETDKAAYSGTYLERWTSLAGAIQLPDMPFTNFSVIRDLAKVIPKNSILHLSILNSTRLMQFFPLDSSITVYSNVNAYGIDGALPTFFGQACATDRPAYLVIGDLSFFYGMNALGIRHRGGNIRILLINNSGSAEFNIQPDSPKIKTMDLHIGAAHSQTAKGWAQDLGYTYLFADSEDSFRRALADFVNPARDQPALLEVFTDMRRDGQFCLSVYRHMERCIEPVVERMLEQ